MFVGDVGIGVLSSAQDNETRLPQLQQQLALVLGMYPSAFEHEFATIFVHPEREALIKQILRQASIQDKASLVEYLLRQQRVEQLLIVIDAITIDYRQLFQYLSQPWLCYQLCLLLHQHQRLSELENLLGSLDEAQLNSYVWLRAFTSHSRLMSDVVSLLLKAQNARRAYALAQAIVVAPFHRVMISYLQLAYDNGEQGLPLTINPLWWYYRYHACRSQTDYMLVDKELQWIMSQVTKFSAREIRYSELTELTSKDEVYHFFYNYLLPRAHVHNAEKLIDALPLNTTEKMFWRWSSVKVVDYQRISQLIFSVCAEQHSNQMQEHEITDLLAIVYKMLVSHHYQRQADDKLTAQACFDSLQQQYQQLATKKKLQQLVLGLLLVLAIGGYVYACCWLISVMGVVALMHTALTAIVSAWSAGWAFLAIHPAALLSYKLLAGAAAFPTVIFSLLSFAGLIWGAAAFTRALEEVLNAMVASPSGSGSVAVKKLSQRAWLMLCYSSCGYLLLAVCQQWPWWMMIAMPALQSCVQVMASLFLSALANPYSVVTVAAIPLPGVVIVLGYLALLYCSYQLARAIWHLSMRYSQKTLPWVLAPCIWLATEVTNAYQLWRIYVNVAAECQQHWREAVQLSPPVEQVPTTTEQSSLLWRNGLTLFSLPRITREIEAQPEELEQRARLVLAAG